MAVTTKTLATGVYVVALVDKDVIGMTSRSGLLFGQVTQAPASGAYAVNDYLGWDAQAQDWSFVDSDDNSYAFIRESAVLCKITLT